MIETFIQINSMVQFHPSLVWLF